MSDLPPNWRSPDGPVPPQFPPPPMPPARPAKRLRVGVWIAVAVVALLAIGGGVTAAVVLNSSTAADAAEVVTLEPATAEGADPFLDSVAITEVTTFPDSVQAVVTDTAAGLTTDPQRGTLTSVGTADNLYGGRRAENAELYGGSGQVDECDIGKLAEFLAANPDKAKAWASVRDIAPARIADYLKTLTPVVLLHDTMVTNYGFSNGSAVPRQSVLQAGTGVLVDPTGQPVVRCACGNPLSAPTVSNLSSAELQGTRWDGYDPARTVAVTGGQRTAEFRLVDVATGESYTRQIGPATTTAGKALLAAAAGKIHRSADGQTWTQVAGPTAAALAHLAVGDGGLIVAVGGVPQDAEQMGSGLIMTSPDGLTWGDPITVQDHLVDVAFGDGQWLAIGAGEDLAPDAGEDSVDFPVYRSTDGATWNRTEVSVNVELGFSMNALTVVHGNGQWLVDAYGGLGDGGVQALIVSNDGSTWTAERTNDIDQAAGGAHTHGRAWNGELWGLTGVAIYFDNGINGPSRDELRVGGSTDGRHWQPSPGTPTGLYIPSLSCTGDRGWLAVGAEREPSSAFLPGAIYTSADLLTWTNIGGPDGGVTDVVPVGDKAAPAPGNCRTPDPAPAAPAGECFVADLDGTTPNEWVAVSDPPQTMLCPDMQARWTQYVKWPGEKRGTIAAADFPDGWTCLITPLSAQLPGQNEDWDGRWGECRTGDQANSVGFVIYSAGQQPGTGTGQPSTTVAAPAPTAGAPAAAPVAGDLNLSVPMTKPACDGTGIVLLFSSIDPSAYGAEIQNALNSYPGSSYLRTDQACSSLNQSSNGNPIYSVYRPIGPNRDAVCAAVDAAGPPAYGKWLDNTTEPNTRIDCETATGGT